MNGMLKCLGAVSSTYSLLCLSSYISPVVFLVTVCADWFACESLHHQPRSFNLSESQIPGLSHQFPTMTFTGLPRIIDRLTLALPYLGSELQLPVRIPAELQL